MIGPRIVIKFNLYSLCGFLLYFGASTLQFWRPKHPKLLSKQESFVFQVLSIYFKTHHSQKSLENMVHFTPSGWCATNSCNSHGLWFASYSPPQNINLQTSRGRCSGGELLVSGRVAEKRATLRKTNAACEKWCFGRLLFLWAGRSICRGLYEFRGNYCSIIISYHIRIISQRGVRDSPLDEIECYLVPKHPRTFLF